MASNAFLGKFVTLDTYPMACQTLNETGVAVPVPPATPDLDPGYHTGLPIIDFLKALARA